MRLKSVALGIVSGLLLAAPAGAQPPAQVRAPSQTSSLPVIGTIVEYEKELELTSAQMERLERLGLDVVREMIRRQADLIIAELDVAALVDRSATETIDLPATEAKTREAERIRADLRLVFVRALEAAKNQLTPEQRSKLITLVANTDSAPADPPGPPGDGDDARGATGGAPRPGGGGGQHPAHGAPRPHGEHHGRPHGHVFIGVAPWWPAYPYWDYPGWVYEPPPVTVEPPVYLQQQPPAPPPYWYYCPSANAYYPAVSTCPEPWVPVPPRAG